MQKSPHDQSPATQYFYEITPERILRAVETLGVRCTGRVLQLNSMENRVYEVELDLDDSESLASPSQRFRIIKFYRPGRWTKEQILEEHQFLADLRSDDIPVISPIKFGDGQTLHLEKDSEIWYTIFPKAGGRSPDELSDEQLERVGRLLARLHQAGKRRDAPHRVRLTPETYGRYNVEYLASSNTLPVEIVKSYSSIVENICQISGEWFKEAAYQRIHGDSHLGNVIWGRDGIFMVDFDDMAIGPCVQDFWLLLPGRDEEARRQLRVMLSAYEQLRSFDQREIRLIEPLRALRLVHYSAWIARRWQDPAFPRSFPHFGSNQYWREQLADLQEISGLIQEDPYLFAH